MSWQTHPISVEIEIELPLTANLSYIARRVMWTGTLFVLFSTAPIN